MGFSFWHSFESWSSFHLLRCLQHHLSQKHCHITSVSWLVTGLTLTWMGLCLSNISYKVWTVSANAVTKYQVHLKSCQYLHLTMHNAQCQLSTTKRLCALILDRQRCLLVAWKENERETELHHCLIWNWVNANSRWLSSRNTLLSLQLSWWSNQLLKHYWMMPRNMAR